MATQNTQDHRVRVGAQRREKTRIRILENALIVFNEKGPDMVVAEDFIAAAGVSRGTFYNHFNTIGELLVDLAGTMSDEVLHVVDPLVLKLDNPVERFSMGTRLYMQMALRYPLWGAFLRRVGTQLAARGQLIETYLTRDLTLAYKKKMLNVKNVQVAHDIVLGSIFYGIDTLLMKKTLDLHAENIIYHVLMGLGIEEHEAHQIAFMPLPKTKAVEGPIFSKLKFVEDANKGTKKHK
jgi:AcrR family transcriptional regulator